MTNCRPVHADALRQERAIREEPDKVRGCVQGERGEEEQEARVYDGREGLAQDDGEGVRAGGAHRDIREDSIEGGVREAGGVEEGMVLEKGLARLDL